MACKLCHLVVHVLVWLSAWSYGHVVAWCGMVLLFHPWWHYRHDGGSPAVLCDVVSVVVFVIISWFPRAPYRSWWPPLGHGSPYCLEEWGPRSLSLGSWFLLAWMASKSRPSSWIPSHYGWDRTYVLLGHIWMVVIHTYHHRLVVLSYLCRGAEMVPIPEMAVLLVLVE